MFARPGKHHEHQYVFVGHFSCACSNVLRTNQIQECCYSYDYDETCVVREEYSLKFIVFFLTLHKFKLLNMIICPRSN